MSRGLLGMAAALAAILLLGLRFERSRLNAKELSLIACLAALAALGRIPFAALPGVQPTTFVTAVSGAVFGPLAGAAVGAASALASNLMLGEGPWTPWQMLAWGACGWSAGVLLKGTGPGLLALFTFAWGFLFGAVMNFWYWYSFAYPLTPASWLAVSAASLPFDTLHAAGNAVFSLLLGPGFLRALRWFRKRLELSSLTCYNP